MDAQSALSIDFEMTIARTIACRYGDGGVYLPREREPTAALALAMRAGFVSEDGFVTRKGRSLLARFDL
jgi:hypothetical protein